ncbi:unnamed protein product [Linum tenue]|uniref:Uncharacterized protein n=1 Tax=Linum tenue TaxID=586396 RepID=A0AAV0LLH1_9ROSI|nr:unnamed protein product [Linum tenue]
MPTFATLLDIDVLNHVMPYHALHGLKILFTETKHDSIVILIYLVSSYRT